MMGKVIALLKTPWFVVLIGLLLLSLLIWFGGPYLGFGQHQPLASAVVRLIVIILILLAWAIWLQVQQLRARRKAAKMAGEMAGQDAGQTAAADGDQRQASERAQLQARFQEAVDTLRQTRRGGGNLYSLPWYVVIGPPGSGKSTLLLNSGLNFPLSKRFGSQALRGVGGTRNCDWWFTDDAIFLDTAGRYTTQDSDRGADASAWEEFLNLLRKYRKRRPINGVVVALSVADLLVLDERGVEQHVAIVRQRLDELTRILRVAVPIYVVFTKCDLIAGFTEFFDDLDPESRSQVWGASFPIDRTLDGSATKGFVEEFKLLVERLDQRILDRLHAERDRGRRAAALSFPQQFAALRHTAGKLLDGIFTAHQYAAPLQLRGFYFTSGTQEGTPIDRMMGAVARTFGLEARRVHAPGAQTRTFFVSRLLKDVLFKESGLAGTNPKIERQKMFLQIAGYAAVVLVTVLLIVAFATSFSRNSSYLGDVQTALDKYPQNSDLAKAPNRQTFFALMLERLEALSAANDVANAHRGDIPVSMRFGLYQGQAVGGEVQDAYYRELNGSLLPSVAALFRDELVAHASDPQALYYYLKGYLMLGQPKHANPAELEALAQIEWRKLFPTDPVLQKALNKHFSALYARPEQLRALPLDDALVEQARNTLKAADLASLIYGSMKLSVRAMNPPPLRLDQQLGLLGNVFSRKSGTPLSEPFPALYTQPVFAEEAGKGIQDAVAQFAKDGWVFGTVKIDRMQQGALAQQVLGLYERDYIKAWDGLLADLRLQSITSIQQASTVAAKLSGPNSPLKTLLKVVRDNTTDLLRAPDEGAAGRAAEMAKKAAARRATQSALAQKLATITGSPEAKAAKPGKAISDHFEQIDKLTAGAAGATPIDQTLSVLGQLSKTLLTMNDFSGNAGQPNPQLLMARQAVGQLPPPVSTWLATLTGKSAALVASGTKSALGDQFQQTVGKNCRQFTHDRYPFAPGSRTDIPLQNFSELFGYGGSFDGFYKQTLAKLVDASGRYWRWKKGPGAVSGPPGMLREMQEADQIKQMFFRNGANAPEVDFRVTAPRLGPGIGKLVFEVGGQTFTYQPGAPTSMAMKWPGPKPGHVVISGYGTDGGLLAKFDYHGDWALFRALQAAQLKKQSDLRFLATFKFSGHDATVVIQADNLNNPFLSSVLQRFRCGG